MTGPFAMILAGGQSRRMGGGDKALLPLAGRPIISHVIDRIEPQVAALAINANGDPGRFAKFALPVIPDSLPDYPGPLAGVLAAMDWAASHGADSVITVAGDTPFIPCDLTPRLLLAAEDAASGLAIASGDSRIHPTCALWPVALRPALAQSLAEGQRRVIDWVKYHGAATACFPAGTPDPFFNINTPDDLKQAESWL